MSLSCWWSGVADVESQVWSLREAPWYGSFGLDRLDAEGRIAFEATEVRTCC